MAGVRDRWVSCLLPSRRGCPANGQGRISFLRRQAKAPLGSLFFDALAETVPLLNKGMSALVADCTGFQFDALTRVDINFHDMEWDSRNLSLYKLMYQCNYYAKGGGLHS